MTNTNQSGIALVENLEWGGMKERLLTEGQASEGLNVSVALLRKWRRLGIGPRYHKLGSLVRYSRTDIAEYITGQRVEIPAIRRQPTTTGTVAPSMEAQV